MGGVAFAATDVQTTANGARVLLFGGQRHGISGAMYSFEQASGDGWVLMPDGAEGAGPAPPPRTQHTLNSVGAEGSQDTIIVFAGFLLNVGCENDLWRATVELDELSMPVPRWSKVEAAGEPPCARYGHSATTLEKKGKIVVCGGQDQTVQYNDVFLLDFKADAWSTPTVTGTPPIVRMKHTANAISDKTILVFGGFNRQVDVRVMADAYKLELTGDDSVAWSAVTLGGPAGSKGIPARAQHAACVTADMKHMFVFGGYNGEKVTNDLWHFELGSMAVRQIGLETPLPEPRARHSIHIIEGLLHVFGGYDNSKPCEGNVFTLDVSDPAGMEDAAAGGDDKKKKEEKPQDEDEY